MRQAVFFLLFAAALCAHAQRTLRPAVVTQNNDCTVDYVEINDTSTVFALVFQGKGGMIWSNEKLIGFSSRTKLITTDGNYDYTVPIRRLLSDKRELVLDKNYSFPGRKKTYRLYLVFEKIPAGCTRITIADDREEGLTWKSVTINNPAASVPHRNWSESDIRSAVNASADSICGIYESSGGLAYRLACVKENDNYTLLYLGGGQKNTRWQPGDEKAKLHATSSPAVFRTSWYMSDKSEFSDAYIIFNKSSMETFIRKERTIYQKVYP